ncbi:MAG: hypothetical protein ABW199_12345 [Caulobacterales bacterium]
MQGASDLFGESPLNAARAKLRLRFPAERENRRLDPVSQFVRSFLGSQTYDHVSDAAFLRLKKRYASWDDLMRADPTSVQALIADVTYAEVKAPFMIGALQTVHDHAGSLTLDFLAPMSEHAALAWLERIKGVGRRIAAAVLNFSSLQKRALVIDTHVLQVSQRLGWISPRVRTAERAYDGLMALLSPAWDAEDLAELHWLLKRLGQSFCRFHRPECSQCPLRRMCPRIGVNDLPAESPPLPDKHAPKSDLPAIENGTAELKARIEKLERRNPLVDWGVVSFGDVRIDSHFHGGGLARGRLHEIAGEGLESETPAAVTGFAAALARVSAREGAIIWALQRADAHAPGLVSLGLEADRVIFVRAASDSDVLAVCEDALRTRGVGAVIGETAALSTIASKRLQLACEFGGACAFILRRRLYTAKAHNEASVAATRWRIASAPSESIEPGLGLPRWRAVLERSRNGRNGAWVLEHDDAKQTLRVVAELADHAAETAPRQSVFAGRARPGARTAERQYAASVGS